MLGEYLPTKKLKKKNKKRDQKHMKKHGPNKITLH